MRYVSTRGRAPALDFAEVTLAGLASDGGLYVPERWPRLSEAEIAAMRGLPYAELATRVIGYDERWIYMEQVFRRGDTVIADAIVRARFLRSSGGSVDVQEVLDLVGQPPADLVLPDWVETWNRESSAHSRSLGERGRGR